MRCPAYSRSLAGMVLGCVLAAGVLGAEAEPDRPSPKVVAAMTGAGIEQQCLETFEQRRNEALHAAGGGLSAGYTILAQVSDVALCQCVGERTKTTMPPDVTANDATRSAKLLKDAMTACGAEAVMEIFPGLCPEWMDAMHSAALPPGTTAVTRLALCDCITKRYEVLGAAIIMDELSAFLPTGHPPGAKVDAHSVEQVRATCMRTIGMLTQTPHSATSQR